MREKLSKNSRCTWKQMSYEKSLLLYIIELSSVLSKCLRLQAFGIKIAIDVTQISNSSWRPFFSLSPKEFPALVRSINTCKIDDTRKVCHYSYHLKTLFKVWKYITYPPNIFNSLPTLLATSQPKQCLKSTTPIAGRRTIYGQ